LTGRLRLHIDPPEGGWTTVRLAAPGVALRIEASAVPSDSLADLASAANRLMAGEVLTRVVWRSEPGEHEFRFLNEGGLGRLEVREGSSGGPPIVFFKAPVDSLAREVWRAFRRLGAGSSAAEFQAAWGHPFPIDSVRRLGDRLHPRRPLS
jgi:hypothetical protein